MLLEALGNVYLPFLRVPVTEEFGGLAPEIVSQIGELRRKAIKNPLGAPESAIVPLVVHKYNSQKSGVDVLSRQLGIARSSDIGQSRKLVITVLGMFTLSVCQVFRACEMDDLKDIDCRDQLTRKLNAVGSDRNLVFDLARSFRPEKGSPETRAGPRGDHEHSQCGQ